MKNSIEKVGELAKPLLKAGGLFVWELGRGAVLTLVITFAVLIVVYPKLSGGPGFAGAAHTGGAGAGLGLLVLLTQPRGIVLVLLLLVFPFAYAMAVQKRAVGRALHSMLQSHGLALYDLTIGRFVEKEHAKSPGVLVSLLSQPNAFASKLQDYLANSEKLPKLVQRMAVRFANDWVEKTSVKGLFVQGQVVQPETLRGTVAESVQSSEGPSWQLFGIIFAAHMLVAGLAWWYFR